MFTLLIITLFMGCFKDRYEPVPPLIEQPNPCGDSTKELRYQWQIPLLKDTARNVGSGFGAFDDKVGIIIADKMNQRLMVYDAKKGTYSWQHIITPDNLGTKSLSFGKWKNRLILNCYFRQHILDDQTGQLISIPAMPNGRGDYRMKIIANHIYQDGGADQFHDSVNQVMRLNLETLAWDTVCSLKRKDHFGYMGGIEPPALHINNAKDSILMFKFRTIAPTGAPVSRLFFYAYNLTQKRVEWRKDSLDYDGSIYPPIVEGNRVYVDGLFSVYCLDANTGNIIWSKYVASRFQGSTGLFLYKDKIAGITLDGSFVCLDKETGNVVYQYKDDSRGQYDLASPSPAVQYNGVLYVMAGSYFYGLDIETGAMLGKYKSPNRCKYGSALFGYSGIAVNAQAGLVFVDDEYFLMAIKAFK